MTAPKDYVHMRVCYVHKQHKKQEQSVQSHNKSNQSHNKSNKSQQEQAVSTKQSVSTRAISLEIGRFILMLLQPLNF